MKINVAKLMSGLRSVVWPLWWAGPGDRVTDQQGDLDLGQQGDERHPSERPQIPLWVLITGHARPSQLLDWSGSIVARGGLYGEVSATGSKGCASSSGGLRCCQGRGGAGGALTAGPIGGGLPAPRGAGPGRGRAPRPTELRAEMALAETRASSSSSPAMASSLRAGPLRPAEQELRPGGQGQGDPASVLGGVGPLDRAPLDQALDHGGDARGRHGQLLGQRAGRVCAPGDLDEHPVLGRRKVSYLDLTGEPGDAVQPIEL
jgi:hypothetical protein